MAYRYIKKMEHEDMKKPLLSVALAIYNESENLERCLLSIQSIADEIVIVDGGSTDNSIDIARSFGAKIISTSNPLLFHINKDKAVRACQGEWILQLDADEEVSVSLQKEIVSVISMSDDERSKRIIDPKKARLFQRHAGLISKRDSTQHSPMPITAYYVPRRNYFLGKAMTYAGMYPDGVIRLFKRGSAHVPAKSVHEQLSVIGNISWLEHDLYHYSNPTVKRYIQGAKRYTSLLAEEIAKERTSALLLCFHYCLIQPAIIFFRLYIRHKGFLDGLHGFLFSFFSALHYPVAYYLYIRKKL